MHEVVTYPIEPVAKPRMTQRDKWKKRPSVIRYRGFKDACAKHMVYLPQPCRVVFYLPMPKSWPMWKCEELENAPHRQKPDLDNLLKGLMDAVMKDDSGVWSICAEKRWDSGTGHFTVEST